MDKPTILIVDDEEDFCQTVSDILVHSGYNTIVNQNPVERCVHQPGKGNEAKTGSRPD